MQRKVLKPDFFATLLDDAAREDTSSFLPPDPTCETFLLPFIPLTCTLEPFSTLSPLYNPLEPSNLAPDPSLFSLMAV